MSTDNRLLSDRFPRASGYHPEWVIAPENATEIRALEADAGRNLGYVRVVGRRRAEAPLYDPVVSIPAQYTKKPLLRSREQ